MGSWSSMNGHDGLRLPVTPARGQILMFDGPRGLLRRVIMSEQAYAVQRRDGRLLVGSTVEFVGYDKGLTVQGIHAITSGIRRLSRALDSCTFLDAWAGLRPYSIDHLPILGPTGLPGLYAATGHFRHGILLAPATAGAMAELLLHGKTSLDLTPFSPLRFARR